MPKHTHPSGQSQRSVLTLISIVYTKLGTFWIFFSKFYCYSKRFKNPRLKSLSPLSSIILAFLSANLVSLKENDFFCQRNLQFIPSWCIIFKTTWWLRFLNWLLVFEVFYWGFIFIKKKLMIEVFLLMTWGFLMRFYFQNNLVIEVLWIQSINWPRRLQESGRFTLWVDPSVEKY